MNAHPTIVDRQQPSTGLVKSAPGAHLASPPPSWHNLLIVREGLWNLEVQIDDPGSQTLH